MGPQLLTPLEQAEQPLKPVLARMEFTGIRIDVPYLQGLSEEMGTTLQQLESDAKAAHCRSWWRRKPDASTPISTRR